MIHKIAIVLLANAAMISAQITSATGIHDWAFGQPAATALFGPGQNNVFDFTYVSGASVTNAAVTFVETILEKTCTSAVIGNGLSVTTAASASGVETTAGVSVDFSTLGSFYTPTVGVDTEGKLEFCLRVEVVFEGEIMNYADTIVTATFNIENNIADLAGFSVVDKDAFDQTGLTADVNYVLNSYVCDGSNVVVANPPAIAPGGSVKFCIELTGAAAGVTLGSIYNVELSQAGTSITSPMVTTGEVKNSYTTISCDLSTVCSVQTTIIGAFFESTGLVSASGSCLMDFGVRGRKLVKIPSIKQRSLQDTDTEPQGTFELDLQLETEPEANADDSSVGNGSAIVATAVLIAGALL